MASGKLDHAVDVFDLRNNDSGDTSLDITYRLQYLWPNPLDEACRGTDFGDLSTTGVDSAVLLLRHLFSLMPRELGDPAFATTQERREEMKNAEQNSILLRYVWQNVPCPKDPTSARGVIAKQAEYLLRLVTELDLQKNPSFFSIAEGQNLRDNFWNRREFHLYSSHLPYTYRDPNEVEHWIDHHDNMEGIVDRSLIHWTGEGDLAKHIGAMFGCFEHGDAGLHIIRRPGFPVCLRVLYKPSGDQAPGFQQLRSLLVEGRKFTVNNPEERLEFGDIERRYNLIAAVCLRLDFHDEDFIRLYTLPSCNIRPPFREGTVVPYNSDDWRIGHQGREYMLYFGLTNSDTLPTHDLEVLHPSQERLDRINLVSSMAASDGAISTGAPKRLLDQLKDD